MLEQEYYTVGEAALVVGISKKALRYYDAIHLLSPVMRNPENNYRYYSKNQIIMLLTIKRLRQVGCSIEQIRDVVEKNDIESMQSQFKSRMSEIEAEIVHLQGLISAHQELIERLDQAVEMRSKMNSIEHYEDYLFSNYRIENIPKLTMFSERRMMPNYDINEPSVNFWSDLYSKCERMGYKNTGLSFVTYHCNLLEQFAMKDCDLSFGIKIQGLPDGANLLEFGNFTAATAIHMGGYDTMFDTYRKLLQWINKNGYEVDGEISEEFIIAPAESTNQENQIIKVIMPVRKK